MADLSANGESETERDEKPLLAVMKGKLVNVSVCSDFGLEPLCAEIIGQSLSFFVNLDNKSKILTGKKNN